MNPGDSPASTWESLTEAFYRPPNALRLDTGGPAFTALLEAANAAYSGQTGIPYILPASADGRNICYVCLINRDDVPAYSGLTRSFLGSWVSIGALTDREGSTSELDLRAFDFVGANGALLRLTIAEGAVASTAVAVGLRRLSRALAEKPRRRIALKRPLGRQIAEFWDACAESAEIRAHTILQSILVDHRLSRTNGLFLRLQFLATFERWSELAELAELPDMVRLQRSAMASDALARLAMRDLHNSSTVSDAESVLARFGGLVPSTALIRSAAGAAYYAHWAQRAGDEAWLIARRLQDSGWFEVATDAGLVSFLTSNGVEPADDASALVTVDMLHAALDEGRFDSAVSLLRAMQPTLKAVPLLGQLVLATLSPIAIDTLQRWKEVLGSNEVDQALRTSTLFQPAVAESILGFPDAFSRLPLADSAEARGRLLDRLRETGVAFLMRTGSLQEFRDLARAATTDPRYEPEVLFDLLLDLERDLSLSDGRPSGLLEFRHDLVEFWSLLDGSGDRSRINRVVAVVERMLAAGVGIARFDELVEYLRAGWTPFLTDVDVRLGLDVIELLLSRRPDDSGALYAFAIPILTRIGGHNTVRLGAPTVEAACVIAEEFGVMLDIPAQSLTEFAGEDRVIPHGTFIAIYSLMESALHRATRVVSNRFPQVRVEALADSVSTPALTNAGRYADVLVIADRAATHSATQALLVARGQGGVEYAQGKGTTSLLDAVYRGLDRMASLNVTT